MKQDELDTIRAALAGLDPDDNGHWDDKGNPNLNVVADWAGVKAVRASTLVSHGLMITRDEQRANREGQAQAAAGGALTPPEPPPKPKAEPKYGRFPFETGLSFGRDVKALKRCKELGLQLADILSKSQKKTGDIMAFEQKLEHFLEEVDRGLGV